MHEDTRGAEPGQLARLLDERLDLARVAGPVDEPGIELLARGGDRLARLAEILDVVQRVVQAEDLDPALGRRGNEAPDEIAADRVRADEEAAAQRHRKRRLRALVECADPLPGALDAAAYGGVEDAAARDLQIREPSTVEDLREPQEIDRRHVARKRLLPEQPDRRVDELRHAGSLAPPNVP